CGPVDVPDDIKQKGVFLITPPSPQKTVAEIRSLPLKSNVSLVGRVVKDDGIRNVKVGGTETNIHTIKVQTNDGQEINVSLWREMSTVPIYVGQFLRITQCITGEWQGQPQLNSSRNTAITTLNILQEVETPERDITWVVEGVCMDEEQIEIVLNTDSGYADLIVNVKTVICGLSGEKVSDRDSLEETLSDMLPFNVRVTTKGNEVVSIALEDA
ncbi:uncharacterized protein, partial [Argopecten irradians]|uniref:uncharacterized protein n=1 Tax=Argopecten irradians TaxID=31199 RepID=UPI003718A9D2